jgi:hypothetical protein
MIEDEYARNNRPRSAPGTRRPTSSNTKTFDEFLARQHNQERKKQERIVYIKSTMEPPQKTFINKKSEEMMTGNQASLDTSLKSKVDREAFEKRLKQSEMRRETNKKLIEERKGKGLTFRPKINASSKALPPRSFQQMSQGDYEVYKQRVEERKSQLAKKEMEEVTFKPKTNYTDGTKGYLRITSDPASYMDRLRVQNLR